MMGAEPVSTRTMLLDDANPMDVSAVVCVAPSGGFRGLNEVELSNANSATQFLLNIPRRCLSSQETEQVAVNALSYLLGGEFDLNKILICGWGNWANGNVLSVLQVINAWN